jgi:hypothetical protein
MPATHTYVVIDEREEISVDPMGTAHKKYVFVVKREEDGVIDEISFIDNYPSDEELGKAIAELHSILKGKRKGKRVVITE